MPKAMTNALLLMADDDAEDRLLARDALRESRLNAEVRFVEDGEELLDYLHRRGRYAPPAPAPVPGLVLLDLNMPRKDGREALAEIKNDPRLRKIPVVVLTTSKRDEDVQRSYSAGANSFVVKPVTFQGLVDLMMTLKRYWLETVELPACVRPT